MTSKPIYPYVYKIVDTHTNEFYIGSRHGNVSLGLTPEEDFLRHYYSSGKFKTIIKDDPSRFKGSIVFRSGEPEAAYWYEQLLIRENIEDQSCVNGHFIDPDNGIRAFSTAGTKRSEDSRLKQSMSTKGIPKSSESNIKRSNSLKGRAWSLSDESKEKRIASLKGKNTGPQDVVHCPHCNKSGGASIMKRWHFDNCKFRI